MRVKYLDSAENTGCRAWTKLLELGKSRHGGVHIRFVQRKERAR